MVYVVTKYSTLARLVPSETQFRPQNLGPRGCGGLGSAAAVARSGETTARVAVHVTASITTSAATARLPVPVPVPAGKAVTIL